MFLVFFSRNMNCCTTWERLLALKDVGGGGGALNSAKLIVTLGEALRLPHFVAFLSLFCKGTSQIYSNSET